MNVACTKDSFGLCFPSSSGEAWCHGGTMEGSGYKVGWVGLCVGKHCDDWKAFKTLPHIFIMDFFLSLLLQNLSK